jgi:hypothetical protein
MSELIKMMLTVVFLTFQTFERYSFRNRKRQYCFSIILHKVHVVLFYHFISNDNQIQVVSNFDSTAFYGYEMIIFQKFEMSKHNSKHFKIVKSIKIELDGNSIINRNNIFFFFFIIEGMYVGCRNRRLANT